MQTYFVPTVNLYLRSPNTFDAGAWYVKSDGDVNGNFRYDLVSSYGSPHFNDIAYNYYVHLVGYIDVSINVHNSYGK